MEKQLQQRVQWVWDNRTNMPPEDAERWRYVARAYSRNGTGWGVYDRREGRFVEGVELAMLPMDQLAMPLAVQ